MNACATCATCARLACAVALAGCNAELDAGSDVPRWAATDRRAQRGRPRQRRRSRQLAGRVRGAAGVVRAGPLGRAGRQRGRRVPLARRQPQRLPGHDRRRTRQRPRKPAGPSGELLDAAPATRLRPDRRHHAEPLRGERASSFRQRPNTRGPVTRWSFATGGRLTEVADAFLMDQSFRDRVVVVASLGPAGDDPRADTFDPNGGRDALGDLHRHVAPACRAGQQLLRPVARRPGRPTAGPASELVRPMDGRQARRHLEAPGGLRSDHRVRGGATLVRDRGQHGCESTTPTRGT